MLNVSVGLYAPVFLGSSCIDICCNKYYLSWETKSRWFLNRENLRVPLINSKLGELNSSLLFPPGPVTLKLFVLSLCQSLHLLSDWFLACLRLEDLASLPALWLISCSFPFSLEGGLETYSSLHIEIEAEETSLGLPWVLVAKYHCKEFLCAMAGLTMSFFFCVTDVGNRKSEEPAMLRCLRKQVGKTSWRNQWPDFINRFSYFPELAGNDSGWHWYVLETNS